MVETSRGRNYSYSEVSEMLTGAGFKNIEKRPLAGPAEIVNRLQITQIRALIYSR